MVLASTGISLMRDSATEEGEVRKGVEGVLEAGVTDASLVGCQRPGARGARTVLVCLGVGAQREVLVMLAGADLRGMGRSVLACLPR